MGAPACQQRGGLQKSPTHKQAACREELLRGPFFYVLVLLAATLLSWRTSAVGLCALAMMCGGDGLADVIGRNFKGPKLPYNTEKSVLGSTAMLLGALEQWRLWHCRSHVQALRPSCLHCRGSGHDDWPAASLQVGGLPDAGPL